MQDAWFLLDLQTGENTGTVIQIKQVHQAGKRVPAFKSDREIWQAGFVKLQTQIWQYAKNSITFRYSAISPILIKLCA